MQHFLKLEPLLAGRNQGPFLSLVDHAVAFQIPLWLWVLFCVCFIVCVLFVRLLLLFGTLPANWPIDVLGLFVCFFVCLCLLFYFCFFFYF